MFWLLATWSLPEIDSFVPLSALEKKPCLGARLFYFLRVVMGNARGKLTALSVLYRVPD
jgi:hypothetical protein